MGRSLKDIIGDDDLGDGDQIFREETMGRMGGGGSHRKGAEEEDEDGAPALEWLTDNRRYKRGAVPYLTLHEKRLYINREAMDRLAWPEHVRVGLDEDQRILALQPGTPGEDFPLVNQKKDPRKAGASICRTALAARLQQMGMTRGEHYPIERVAVDGEDVWIARI